MKRILFFISGAVVFWAAENAQAQMLDDLFDEEELQTSESENAGRQAEAPVEKKPEPSAPRKAVPEKDVSTVSQKMPAKTFKIPNSLQERKNISAMPQLGIGQKEAMPNLGKKEQKNKKDDESLSLFEMRARKMKNRDVDVMSFDIAGISLKMTPENVMERAAEAGFSLKFKNMEIPESEKWKYHRKCLGSMIFSYKVKQECIRETARMNNSEYVRQLVFEKKGLRETVTVDFTSHFNGNQAYRVYYLSKGDHSLGTTDEAHYLKERRRAEFLEVLIRKYGPPEDETALLWGIAGFGAVLQADISENFQDASLLLEDLSFEEEDYKAASDEDVKSDPLGKFSF